MKGSSWHTFIFPYLHTFFPSVQLHFIADTKRNKFSFQKIRSKIKFSSVKNGSRITLEVHWSNGSEVI